MKERSIRRHHIERLKKSRSGYYLAKDKNPVRIGKLAHTTTMCSCLMCGNPRRNWNQKTWQEVRFLCDRQEE